MQCQTFFVSGGVKGHQPRERLAVGLYEQRHATREDLRGALELGQPHGGRVSLGRSAVKSRRACLRLDQIGRPSARRYDLEVRKLRASCRQAVGQRTCGRFLGAPP
jgi:hypothetical protein